MNNTILKVGIRSLDRYLRTEAKDMDEKIEKMIIKHALAAAAAAVASGWIPGAGSTIATGIAIGFVWAMYYRLCSLLNIPISKNILKTLASVVIAEVAAYVGVVLVASAAISFIPAVGNLSASWLCAIMNFGMVYAAGYIFILMISEVLKAKTDAGAMSEKEWEEKAKDVMKNINMKEVFKEAKKSYKSAKDSGEYSGYESVKPMEKEE